MRTMGRAGKICVDGNIAYSQSMVVAVLCPQAKYQDLVSALFDGGLHCLDIIDPQRLSAPDLTIALQNKVPNTTPLLVVLGPSEYRLVATPEEANRLLSSNRAYVGIA
jgi:hypothetical protein